MSVIIEKVKKALDRKGIEYSYSDKLSPTFIVSKGMRIHINRIETEIKVCLYGSVEVLYNNDDEITGIEIGKAVRKADALLKKYGVNV